MRIGAISPLLATVPVKAPAKNEPFAVREDAAPQRAMKPVPPASVEMLIAVAAVEAPAEQRARTVRRANEGLDRLGRLRDAMLRGDLDAETLNGLASWVSRRGEQGDAGMQSLMEEIELRVLVELAKQDRRS